MPSIKADWVSGGMNILSGVFAALWSGQGPAGFPVGGIQLRADKANSGSLYIALSGNMTIQSGDFFRSGGILSGGILDGMPMNPGDAYLLPKLSFPLSGAPAVFVQPDLACSGQGRLYWERF